MNSIPKHKSVMFVAGEISGDINGSYLLKAIKEENKDYSLSFIGLGGKRMEAEGLRNTYNLTDRGTIGFFEILKFFPYIFCAYRKANKLLKKEKPDLLVLIDYQGFNMRLAKKAKNTNTKVVYYIAPQEWIWGTQKGGKNVAKNVDCLITIFKEEDEFYRRIGAKTRYVGHPILDIIENSDRLFRYSSLVTRRSSHESRVTSHDIIGLFPGSRHQEIDLLFPVILESAKMIKEKYKEVNFVLSLSSSVFEKKIKEKIHESGISIEIVKGKSKEIINASSIIISASGTVTLEAAVLEKPMIVLYKISKASYFLANNILKIKIPFASLPNILLNKMAVPEYIQDDVRASNIAEKTLQILNDRRLYNEIKDDLKKVKSMLGNKGAVRRAAHVVLEELEKC